MEGGSQSQDRGQAIYAKIRYSVSSTFVIGCSFQYPIIDYIKPRGFRWQITIITGAHNLTLYKGLDPQSGGKGRGDRGSSKNLW